MVAELAAVNGFKAAYAIKDGAEGPRGWMVFTILISVLLCFHSLQQSIATWNCHWCIYNSQKLWDALYYCRIAAFPGYCQKKHWVLTLETLLSLSVMRLEYVSQSFDCLLTLIFFLFFIFMDLLRTMVRLKYLSTDLAFFTYCAKAGYFIMDNVMNNNAGWVFLKWGWEASFKSRNGFIRNERIH